MTDDTSILSCVDRWGRPVVATRSQWLDHIVVNHAELTDQVDSVIRTVTHADRIMRDAKVPERENFYRRGVLQEPHAHLYLKVCVEFEDLPGGIMGTIITAHPTGRIKPLETQRWP